MKIKFWLFPVLCISCWAISISYAKSCGTCDKIAFTVNNNTDQSFETILRIPEGWLYHFPSAHQQMPPHGQQHFIIQGLENTHGSITYFTYNAGPQCNIFISFDNQGKVALNPPCECYPYQCSVTGEGNSRQITFTGNSKK